MNSSPGDGGGCSFAKRFAWNPFRRAYPRPFSRNLCNIWVYTGVGVLALPEKKGGSPGRERERDCRGLPPLNLFTQGFLRAITAAVSENGLSRQGVAPRQNFPSGIAEDYGCRSSFSSTRLNRSITSGIVNFFFFSPEASRTILPSCIMIRRFPCRMA